MKAYYVARHTHLKAAAILSIFADRVLGLTELAALAVVTSAVTLLGGLRGFDEMREPLGFLSVVVLVTALMLAFLLSARFRRALHLQKLYQRLPIAHHIRAAGAAAQLYRRRIRLLLWAVLVALAAHVVWVGSIALLAASLSLNVAWYMFFVYVPLIYIVGSIPLTPGGVGLIEGLYVRFLAGPTVGASEVVALALLARLIPILWSLPGAVVAVTGPRLVDSATMKAELGIQAPRQDEGP